MPRKPNLDRPIQLHLVLPESIRARVDLELYSPLEGRVPLGKYQEFFMNLLSKHWTHKHLDLSSLGFPPGFYIEGPKEMIETLERRLKA